MCQFFKSVKVYQSSFHMLASVRVILCIAHTTKQLQVNVGIIIIIIIIIISYKTETHVLLMCFMHNYILCHFVAFEWSVNTFYTQCLVSRFAYKEIQIEPDS
jgi:hypothetical protein